MYISSRKILEIHNIFLLFLILIYSISYGTIYFIYKLKILKYINIDL